jgi:coenzyme PQQ precursor peptide PqqA
MTRRPTRCVVQVPARCEERRVGRSAGWRDGLRTGLLWSGATYLRCSWRTRKRREIGMYWTTPTLVEICVGLEINGYLPAEF